MIKKIKLHLNLLENNNRFFREERRAVHVSAPLQSHFHHSKRNQVHHQSATSESTNYANQMEMQLEFEKNRETNEKKKEKKTLAVKIVISLARDLRFLLHSNKSHTYCSLEMS